MLFVDFRVTDNKNKIFLSFLGATPFFAERREKIGGIQEMTEVNKGILDNDIVISTKNIQKMGEVIALTCISLIHFCT